MGNAQLVSLSLADEESARDLVRQLDAIEKLDKNVTILDAAIALRDGRGKVKLKQLKSSGMGRGGFFGAIGGAFAGITSLFQDSGIDDDMMRRVAQYMDLGEVALFILYTGDWSRSSAVLQDALLAHGIRYVDPNHPSSMVRNARPATQAFEADEFDTAEGGSAEFSDDEFVSEEYDAVARYAEQAGTWQEETWEPEPVWEPVPAPSFTDEPAGDVSPEPLEEMDPVFGDDSAEDYDAEEWSETEDAFADEVALSSMAAADATRAADAQEYAEGVEALSETVEVAGAGDTRQGVEMLDASTAIGEAGARMALLGLERRYSGLEIGRMAGELEQIGREVGEYNMPFLSALLANRSRVLQRIAAEMVASAANARELAVLLDETGAQIGRLGTAEVDEGAARALTARALAAHAARIGAAGMVLEDRAKAELAAITSLSAQK